MTEVSVPKQIKPQIYSIQYLRAAAAVAVVGFHMLQSLPFAWVGAHGVDLFFVISGFIMIALADARPISAPQFLLDRLCRIVPMYYIATILSFVSIRSDGQTTIPNLVFGRVGDLIRSLLFLPYFNAEGHIFPVLYQGWTLNYESFFYAMFALSLLMPGRIRALFLFSLMAGLALIGSAHTFGTAPLLTYTDPHLIEFALGVVAGRLFTIDVKSRAESTIVSGSLATLLLAAACALVWPQLVFGALSVAIIVAMLTLERKNVIPHSQFLLFIGNASYSIYLFQQLGASLIQKISYIPQNILHFNIHDLFIYKAVAFLGALAFGAAIYQYVEIPVIAAVRRIAYRRTHVRPALK